MPHFDILKRLPAQVNPSYRVSKVLSTFDIATTEITERFQGDIDLETPWQIGVVVGPSGSGKSTLIRHLFGDDVVTSWPWEHASLLDDFPKNVRHDVVMSTLQSVGFSTVPSWLKPYSVLSEGEKMRVNLARALVDPRALVVFDEYTSTVDRVVAQMGSFAVQKSVRKTKKKFIACTCHYDVIDWLLPDWVFDTASMQFHRCEKKNGQILPWTFVEKTASCGVVLQSIII